MKTILYVEDDEHDIFFLKRAFGAQVPNVQIQNVVNVPQAMEYLRGDGGFADRKQFPAADLVVSDVSIPGGSGIQLLKWIRGEPRFSKLPVILLSGSTQESQIDKALSSGANFCLEKSTDFKELLSKICSLLGE